MKKIISMVTAVVLCMLLLLPMTVSAASASATLTGPAAVREGDTITVTFYLNGSGLYGASGTLSYDSSQLQFTGTKQVVGSPWMVEFNGNNFVAYDNNLSKPIKSSTALFTATFKVKAAAGTTIKISCTNVTASDGSTDSSVGVVTYSKTVAAAASTNNDLSSLTVKNATVSPAFHAGTTNYTAEVPFSVSKLDVSAVAADAAAKVSVSNPTLTPGDTTAVTVTVTAESGAQKVYTIQVTREQDPNYQPSSNNALSEITVDGFLLSPGFSADVTEYVVWLPYETESITVGGKAEDGKASVEVIGGENLVAGQDNTVKVICAAEDGTEKEYTVIVKRAAAHGEAETEPTKPSETITTTTTAAAPTDTTPKAAEGLPLWAVIAAAIAGLGIGFAVGFIVKKSKKA